MKPRECPDCGSARLRLSHRSWREKLLSTVAPRRPYRCADCNHRFSAWSAPLEPVRVVVWTLLLATALVLLPNRKVDRPVDLETEPPAPREATVELLERRIAGLEARLIEATSEHESEIALINLQIEEARALLEAKKPSSASPATEPTVAAPLLDIGSAVDAWAAAWSAQRVGDYLAAYSADYHPPGSSRIDWMAQRTERIRKPSRIALELSDVRVEILDPNQAVARFRQRYEADSYSDVVEKTLVLTLEDGGWKIVEESATAL